MAKTYFIYDKKKKKYLTLDAGTYYFTDETSQKFTCIEAIELCAFPEKWGINEDVCLVAYSKKVKKEKEKK